MRDWWGQISGLLGVGLVLSMLVVQWQRRRRRRKAMRAFPALAASLGLQHEPGEFAGYQGVLRGEYRGFHVVVDPDEERNICVRFSGQPRVDLRSVGSTEPVPADMLPVVADDLEFNRFWKTRRASAAIADRLATAAKRAWIEPFQGRFAGQVRTLLVSADGITCELDFGTPPYMPVDAVRELLAGCVALAAAFEPAAITAREPDGSPPVGAVSRPLAAAWRRVGERFGVRLALVGLVGLLLELGLAWCTYGTSDLYALEQLGRWASYLGAGVYAAADVPHPAPVLSLLRGLSGLAHATHLPFAFWLRLSTALASTGALALVFALMADRLGETRVRAGLLLLAASPPLILVAGFHGSVHPIMVFWLLLSVYLTQRRGSDVLAGAAFGLSACFALLPLAALPVLLLSRPTWARRGRFVAAAGSLLVAGWGPWLGADLGQLLAQRGQHASWGLSWLALELAPGPWPVWLRVVEAPLLLAGSIAACAWLHRRSPRPSPYTQVGIVVLAWLALQTTFDVQHLAWLGPWLVGLPLTAVSLHVLCASAVAIVAYIHGSGAPLGYFVDMGVSESAALMEHQRLLCWLSVLLMLGAALAATRPRRLAYWDFAPAGLRRGLLLAATIALAWPSIEPLRRAAASERAAAERSLAELRGRGDINLSSLLLRAGHNREGVEVAQAAVLREPTRALAWNNLAAGYAALARWDDAVLAAQRALALSPDFELARNNLAWTQQRQAEAQAQQGARAQVARRHRSKQTSKSYQPASDAVSR